MPSGFYCETDTGNIQVTDEFQNLVLIAKGTITLGDPWIFVSTTGGPYATITLPNYYGYPPLIVLAGPTPVYVRDAVQDGAGNWVFGMAGQYASVPGGVIEWYAFGPAHAGLPRENYGLEVFRADGSLAFSSAWKPLRVVGRINNAGQPTFSGVPGKKYGVGHIIDQFSQSAPIPAGTWRVQGTGTMHSTNGANATLSSGQIYTTVWGTQPPFATQYDQPKAEHLIIDLTGY